MSEWREVALGDLLTFGNGKRKPSTDGSIPIYGGNGILGFTNESNYQDDTIIIGRVGAYCGSVYYETKPIWVSDNALSAKPKNRYNLKFLYYFLKQIELNQYAGGSSHPLVTQTLLNSLEFDVCTDPDIQKAIAEVLSSLDDKIDLLHRQNKTLEQMAETLFRQWFVEEAREDWGEGILGDVIEIFDSRRVPLSKMQRDKMKIGKLYPYYGAATIMDYINDYIFEGEYILLGEDGTVKTPEGYPVLQYASGKFWVNNHTHIIKAKAPYNNFFIWNYLSKKNIERIVTGAVQPKINQTNLKSLDFPVFPKTLVNEYKDIVTPHFDKINKNKTQIRTLESIRDTLLPKLMNGEVRIASHG